MAKAANKDALDDLGFLDDIEGWSINEMARTVGRMIIGADHIAQELASAAASLMGMYSAKNPASPRALKEMASALQQTAKAIECYSGVYSWCLAQGQTGKENANVLKELIPVLETHELRLLETWQERLEELR